MKIRKGANPNCSELIARIDTWTSKEEIKSIIETIEETIDWNFGVGTFGNRKMLDDLELNNAQETELALEGLLNAQKDETKFWQISYPLDTSRLKVEYKPNEPEKNKIYVDMNNTSDLPRKILERSSWDEQNRVRPAFVKSDSVKIKPYLELPHRLDVFGFSKHYGDGRTVELQAYSDNYRKHFPLISKALTEIGGKYYAHDGGSTRPFEQYCDNRGIKVRRL